MAVSQVVTAIRKAVLFNGSMATDFRSDVADIKDQTMGFIQAFYDGHNALDGAFELFVGSEFCGDDNKLARLPKSEMTIDTGCQSVGWNLIGPGYRFIQVRYTANSVTAGTARIIAVCKKG